MNRDLASFFPSYFHEDVDFFLVGFFVFFLLDSPRLCLLHRNDLIGCYFPLFFLAPKLSQLANAMHIFPTINSFLCLSVGSHYSGTTHHPPFQTD